MTATPAVLCRRPVAGHGLDRARPEGTYISTGYLTTRTNLSEGYRAAVDRPFIGESSIPRTNLVEMIAAIETSNPGTTPISSVWMSGSVIVPQRCSLAKGRMLTIDFGAVSYSDLTYIGNTPERTESRTFYAECENISESVGVNISLVGPVHPTQRNAGSSTWRPIRSALPTRSSTALIEAASA